MAAPVPGGAAVNPADFRVTTFASRLGYPVGMALLEDGSMLVAVNSGSAFFNTTGQVVRLADDDRDGIADGPAKVVATGLSGGLTCLRVIRDLVFVTGQGAGRPIVVLRRGALPSDALSVVGRFEITYPSGGWSHPHSALAVRPTPGVDHAVDLVFQVGSDQNKAITTRTASWNPVQVQGPKASLAGDSIHLVTVTDTGGGLVASAPRRIGRGVRNPAGFAFHPVSGDLYFEDNGIDGLVDVNEPTSADELNRISAADLAGGVVPDFGFPDRYTAYRTGVEVGVGGVAPVAAFLPVPEPGSGAESEGANDIAFAPPGFPPGLSGGIFVGFHGKFGLGGTANEENPVVHVDPATGGYFHFLAGRQAGWGHPDGLVASEDALYVADLSPSGGLNAGGGTGVIYRIQSLVPPRLVHVWSGGVLRLEWSHGRLESAGLVEGPWTVIDAGGRTWALTPGAEEAPRYFRVRVQR